MLNEHYLIGYLFTARTLSARIALTVCRDPYPHVKALVISVYCLTRAVSQWFLN